MFGPQRVLLGLFFGALVAAHAAPAFAHGVTASVALSGANHATAGTTGDPDGTGTATIEFNDELGRICFELAVLDIDEPTGAQIQAGTETDTGPVLVDLDLAENGVEGCVRTDPTVVEDILADIDAHYLNIRTADLPDGAIRGQLEKPLPPGFEPADAAPAGDAGDEPEAGANNSWPTTVVLIGLGTALALAAAWRLRRRDADLDE